MKMYIIFVERIQRLINKLQWVIHQVQVGKRKSHNEIFSQTKKAIYIALKLFVVH